MFRFTNYTIYAIVIITRSTRERKREEETESECRQETTQKGKHTHTHTDDSIYLTDLEIFKRCGGASAAAHRA